MVSYRSGRPYLVHWHSHEARGRLPLPLASHRNIYEPPSSLLMPPSSINGTSWGIKCTTPLHLWVATASTGRSLLLLQLQERIPQFSMTAL